MLNVSHALPGNPIFPGDGIMGPWIIPNGQDLNPIQSAMEALSFSQPALGNSVHHVVFLSPQEQMIWINTRAVITSVQDVESAGNDTDEQGVSLTVSAKVFVATSDIPVTVPIAGPQPHPAAGAGYPGFGDEFFAGDGLAAFPPTQQPGTDFSLSRMSLDRRLSIQGMGTQTLSFNGQ